MSFADDIADDSDPPRDSRSGELSACVIGLDLSLNASSGIVCPLDWDGQWSRVRSLVVGETLPKNASDAQKARRTETIAARLVAFAQSAGVTRAFVEGYAFGSKNGREALGELGGVVRLELVRAGIEIRTVPVATARKLLLGTVPKSKPKDAVREALKAAGAPASWSADEMDAFCVANFGLSEVGGYCFAQVEAA